MLGGGEGSPTRPVLSSSFGVHPASPPFWKPRRRAHTASDASEALVTWRPPGRRPDIGPSWPGPSEVSGLVPASSSSRPGINTATTERPRFKTGRSWGPRGEALAATPCRSTPRTDTNTKGPGRASHAWAPRFPIKRRFPTQFRREQLLRTPGSPSNTSLPVAANGRRVQKDSGCHRAAPLEQHGASRVTQTGA